MYPSGPPCAVNCLTKSATCEDTQRAAANGPPFHLRGHQQALENPMSGPPLPPASPPVPNLRLAVAIQSLNGDPVPVNVVASVTNAAVSTSGCPGIAFATADTDCGNRT